MSKAAKPANWEKRALAAEEKLSRYVVALNVMQGERRAAEKERDAFAKERAELWRICDQVAELYTKPMLDLLALKQKARRALKRPKLGAVKRNLVPMPNMQWERRLWSE